MSNTDPEGLIPKKYDLSSLKGINLAGEKADFSTVLWLKKVVPHTTVTDSFGMTETGEGNMSNIHNKQKFGNPYPLIANTIYKSLPGLDLRVLNE